jgi:outer membrane protein assembly factor BamB
MNARAQIVALLVSATIATAYAADWPQYYGPRRDSTSTEKGLLRTWPKEGPKVLWTVPLGRGFAGPAISRGKVYLLDREDKVGDVLRVYDFATGKELWNYAYDAPGTFEFPGSRSTPTVDGNIVYIAGPLGDLHAIDINTHKPLWRKSIWKDFGGGGAFIAFGQRGGGAPAPPRGAPAGAPPAGQAVPPPAGQAVPPPAGQAVPPPGQAGPPTAPRGAQGGAPPVPPGGQRSSPFGPDGFAGGPNTFPLWGITQNPLVYRNLVIVGPQAPEAGVVAYDKLTGELKWKTASLGGTGFVSPSIVRVGAEDQVVMVAAARGLGRNATGGSVNGIDPLTGKVLWTYLNFQCSIPVAHAVDAGEGRVLMTGGYRAGAAMIKIQKKADGTYDVAELFKNPDFGSHTQPPILYKDHFYVQYTINERSDGLVCMTLDGQVKWRTGDEPPFNKGGAVLADGLLLATDGNTKLYLIEPDPTAFKPLASVELLEPGNNWAPLALVDGRLFIRDQKQMKVLQVAQGGR